MKASSLLQHIGIALALTCLAIINNFILIQFFTGLLSARLNISVIVFLYLAYLIWQSRLTAGRPTLLFIDISTLSICLLTSLHTETLFLMYLF